MASPDVEERLGRELVEPLLRRVLQAIVIAASMIAVSSLALGIPRIATSSMINAVVAGLLLWMVRKGWVRTASLIQTACLTAGAIYAIVIGYGLLDVSILTLPALFLLVSVTLSFRWMLVVMLLTNATVAAVGLAQKRGWLVTPTSGLVGYDDVIDAVIMLTTTAAFVQYLVSTMRRSIVQARVAQARTRDILDATGDAIVIHAAESGRIIEANATTVQMLGASRQELMSDDSSAASGGGTKYINMAFEYVQRAVTEGPQSFEWSTQDKDGKTLWLEVVLRAATVADEECVIAVLRDISTRRRLEQRIREAEKFEAVGQLAGGIAHDFNNQLVGILGNAEFVGDIAGSNPDVRACTDSILASGRRAADLTRQLLAFARRARRRNVSVDLHQLVSEVISLARRSIDKRIALEQRLEATRAVTVGDASALQNALLNLLLNARDAIASAGTIVFSTRNVEVPASTVRDSNCGLLPGTHIEIEVSDTGCGINPSVRERIFQPFFTTKTSGTGMGLAAVQGTVLEHQGAVEVFSEPGQGTTFRISLPVTDETAVHETASAQVAPAPHFGRVLVVDDEAGVVSVIRQALERAGYEVDCCNRGEQALECCEAEQFDLILLDIIMPDLDGVEVLRRLRAGPSKAQVIVMTGHAPESIQARLREYPDVTVLPKPFLPKELLREVRETLRPSKAN